MILQLGTGPFPIEGWINTDQRIEAEGVEQMNMLAFPWRYDDNSVDGIVSTHVLQEFQWRDLVTIFLECHRILKHEGFMRHGVPHMHSGKSLNYLLGWGNINLFSFDMLSYVLYQTGFSYVERLAYKQTRSNLDLTKADNRPDETLFLEASR